MVRRFSLVLAGACALALSGVAGAAPYNFQSASGSSRWIDVEYWTGSGSAETILIVDWNNTGNYITESHAFGFRWDGSPTTVATMLAAIDANGPLDITTGYGGEFIYNLLYTCSDGDVHSHPEEGSWNLGSTPNPYAAWGPMSSDWQKLGDWDANQMGIGSEYIANGHLEGINAIWWFDTSKPTLDLTVPAAVPEPASACLLGVGGLLLLRRRRRSVSSVSSPRLPSSRLSPRLATLGSAAAALTLAVASAAQAGYVYDPNDFAVEVVSSSGLPATSIYNDPSAVLGRPSTWFYNQWGSPGNRRVKLVEPAYNTFNGQKLITTIPLNAQITVKMGRKVYDDPNNPYGIDLLVFGNSFFVGSGGTVNDSTNMNTFRIDGSIFAEPMKVSVSPDGVTWYRYENGPYADSMFPTNAYVWDRHNATWTDEEADPTKPVNPALTSADFNGTAADALDLYRSTISGVTFNSAGGTGFDLAESGFQYIQYVRVEGLSGFANGEIDAFAAVSAVPEPASLGLLGLGGLALLRRRRRV